MTGADILGALLLADPEVTDMIAPPSIKLGRLPDNVVLPALLIRVVSSVEQQPLKRWQKTRTIDRVSVTVRAKTYRDQVEALRRARECCAGRTGDLGGGSSVSILTAGAGPDVNGPADTFEQTIDFRVSFDAIT